MEFICTEQSSLPGGHYSQAVIANGLIFVSGLLPIIPNTNKKIPDGIISQTQQVFKNMQAILQAGKSDLKKLVSVQIFISDIEYWQRVNEVFAEMLAMHKPARTIIPCHILHYGALIEANAIALANEI